MNRDASPNTPENNVSEIDYTPKSTGPLDMELRPTPEHTSRPIENLPQQLSVDQLAERSRRGGL